MKRSRLFWWGLAALVAGAVAWYALTRQAAPAADPNPVSPSSDGETGLGGPSTETPAVDGSPAEGETPADAPTGGDSVQTYTAPVARSSGYLQIGTATDPGLLQLELYGDLYNNRGQVRNGAGPVAGPGRLIRYLIDGNLPWRDSIDACWFTANWPHVIDCWEIDPALPSYAWRMDGIRHGQSVFTLRSFGNASTLAP